jgi:hypothetical protein
MYTIIAEAGQTLLDIANQEYGHSDGLKQLVDDNPALISMDDDLEAGTVLNIQDIGTAGYNDSIRQYLKINNIKINSSIYAAAGSGIGFEGIHNDLIII